MFGEAILKITFDSNNVKSSNFGSNSFQITNTGEKTIAQIDINVSNALYPDAVFDPFGEAGDTKSKPLTIDTNGGTGVVTPSNASYIGVGGTAGYEAIQLVFEEDNNNGFEPGETIGFSVDMDPNSLAGTNKSQLDAGTNPSWDAGGVSGAELIGSTFTVTFTDNTTATGQLQGTKNQAGSQALASQDAPNLSVSLTVNGLDAGGVGTYDANGPSVIINGPAGQTARVVLTKGFIQPVTPYAQFLQDQLDLLATSDFPANNAVEFQTVDVLLTGGAQDISNLFDFSGVPNFNFEGEDQLPLGFVASIIDPAKEDLPIGPVTQPIYLEFQKQISENPPSIVTAASVTIPENQTEVLDVNAIDANGDTPGDGLSFSLTGGEDLEAFAIDPNTGALSFTSAPDFENPGDKNGNNVYEVEVTVTDSTNLTDTQLIDVTVSDLNETLGIIELEAEDINDVSGYRIESKSIASGGQMLSLVGQDQDEVGTASFTFTGESGNYNMILGLFDEGDGEASLQVTQNSNPLETIILDENPGVNGPAADTKVERIVATGVTIANGDSFTITGFEDKGEHARFDFIRFVPVEWEPPADSDIEPEPEPAIRINAGGEDYTDLNGNLWYADQYFSGGELYSTSDSINRTELDPIYQTERWLKDLSYDIPVNNGLYSVNLHFAEIHFNGPNQRNFDITIEEEVVSGLDIYASTKNAFDPGHDTALVVNFPQVQVTDGIVDIDLSASVNNSKISGIEIIPLQGAQVILQESQGATVVTENGNGDSYSLVLTEQPSTNVIIDIETDNLLETDKSQLIFTPQNWSTSQTVVVNAINNNQATGTKFGSISHSISSSDSDYDGYTTPELSVKINDDDVVPIKFTQKTIATDIDSSPYVGATVGAWGPDGRLYVGSYNGTIKVFSFDDDYNLIETEVIDTLEGESNPSILGIAFNPFDSSDNPQIYVSHSQLYANGGGAFPETELSPYSGQISILSGANFANLDPLITGLPVSNHDHGVNDIIFDNKGDLYVAIGGNTNAGITNAKIGGIPESPFSAAILKAEITKPDFNGTIEYSLPDDFVPPAGLTFDPATSQVFGDIASVVPGVDVSVYASGFRNAFSLLLTTDDLIYTVENGANASFGDVSTSATTQEPFPDKKHDDELNLVVENGYYGFPNRNRGLSDDIQNQYYAPFEPSQDGYTAPLVDNLVSSSNGLDEYRANSFGGQLKGDLLIQKINVKVSAFSLSEDGSQVVSQQKLDNVADGLDIFTAPRGAIVGVDFWDDKVSVALPDDASIGDEPTAVDIFPWRAPATGGNLFIIGGHNFDDLTNTSVTIGGEATELSSVSDGLIYGTLPSFTNPGELLDVVIESAGQVSVLEDAFLALEDRFTNQETQIF